MAKNVNTNIAINLKNVDSLTSAFFVRVYTVAAQAAMVLTPYQDDVVETMMSLETYEENMGKLIKAIYEEIRRTKVVDGVQGNWSDRMISLTKNLTLLMVKQEHKVRPL